MKHTGFCVVGIDDKGTQNYSMFEDLLYNWDNEHIFYNDEHYLTPRGCLKHRSSITAVSVSDFEIHKKDEEKYKARFVYNGIEYKTSASLIRKTCVKRASSNV